MATTLTKNTFVRGRIKGQSQWVTMHGAFSGMDPPEFAPASEARVVPSQSDFEHNMSSGVTRADMSLTVDLRDGTGDPGSTIPVYQTWTGKTIEWQIAWGAYIPGAGNESTLNAGMPASQFEQVCSGVVPTADGSAWRLAITGPASGPILYGVPQAAGKAGPSTLPAGWLT